MHGERDCALNISPRRRPSALRCFLPHALEFYGGGSETTRELFIDRRGGDGCAGDRAAVSNVILAAARLVADLKLPETMRELTANRKLRMHGL